MLVYLGLFLVIIILDLIMKPSSGQKNKLIYILIVSILLVLVSGLRHYSIGADTLSYVSDFQKHANDSLGTVLQEMKDVYFYGETSSRDPGYGLFRIFVGHFTTNGTIFLLVVALIFTGAMSYSIYKNSHYPGISYVLYVALFFSFYGITGIRQTLATAICTFVGYEFIKRKQLLKFIICVLLAAMLHRSALLYLLFYFLSNRKLTKGYIMFLAGCAIFIFANNSLVYDWLKEGTVYEFYDEMQSSVTWTMTICIIAVTIFALFYRKRLVEKNSQTIHYINACMVSCCFLPLTYINPSTMRIVQYFSLFLLYLLPEFVTLFTEKNSSKKVIYVGMIVALAILCLRRAPEYYFIWQVI